MCIYMRWILPSGELVVFILSEITYQQGEFGSHDDGLHCLEHVPSHRWDESGGRVQMMYSTMKSAVVEEQHATQFVECHCACIHTVRSTRVNRATAMMLLFNHHILQLISASVSDIVANILSTGQ